MHEVSFALSSGLQSAVDEAEADSLLLAAAALQQMSAHKPGCGQPAPTNNSSSCSSQGNCLAAVPCPVPATQGRSAHSVALDHAAAAAKGDSALQQPEQQQQDGESPNLQTLLQALVARAAPAAAAVGSSTNHAPDINQGALLSAMLVAHALASSTPAAHPAPAPHAAAAASAGALAPQSPPPPSSFDVPGTSSWLASSAPGAAAAPQPPIAAGPQGGADGLLEPLQLRSGPLAVVRGANTGAMPTLSSVRQAVQASALSVYVRPMKVTTTKPKKMQLLESQVASARAVNQHLKSQVQDLQEDKVTIARRASDLRVNLCLLMETNRRLRAEYNRNRDAVEALSHQAHQQEQQRQEQQEQRRQEQEEQQRQEQQEQERRQQEQQRQQQELLVLLIQKLVPQVAPQTLVDS